MDIFTIQTVLAAELSPADFLVNAYKYSIILGVVLAFGVIIWAGARMALSQGDSGTISDARNSIWQALLGLAILFSAFLILRTINPELGNLSLPGLDKIDRVPTGGSCNNCSNIQAATGISCKSDLSCEAAPSVVKGLNCIAQKTNVPPIQVTEAYPPTTTHEEDIKHNNGCAVDIKINVSNPTCAQVKEVADIAAQQCGLNVYSEYNKTCAGDPYYGNTSKYQTGENIHLEGCGTPPNPNPNTRPSNPKCGLDWNGQNLPGWCPDDLKCVLSTNSLTGDRYYYCTDQYPVIGPN